MKNQSISEKKLLSSNLPDSFTEIKGKYPSVMSAETVFKRFEITKNELPREITVQKRLALEDYPKSLQNQVYVSAITGDDSFDGSKVRPFKTMERALFKMENSGGGVIWVEGGSYALNDTVEISSSHSGSFDSPLFIKTYGEKNAIFTSDKIIDSSDFKPADTVNDSIAKRLPKCAQSKVVYTNLYEQGFTPDDIVEISKNGCARLYINGEEGVLARYPNAFYEDGVTRTEQKDMLYFKHVYDMGSVSLKHSHLYPKWLERVKGDSSLTPESEIGWELRVLDDNDPLTDKGDGVKGKEILSWVNTGDIWYYGNTHSGYEREYYRMDESCVHDGNLLGLKKDDGYYSLKSVHHSPRGCQPSGNSAVKRNIFYMLNAIEALDAPGEYFIDKKTGNLYLYPTVEDITKARVTYSGVNAINLISIKNASYIVIDGIEINGTNENGIVAKDSDNIIVQNIKSKNTKKSAVFFADTEKSAVLYSDFSYAYGAMVLIENKKSRAALRPCDVFIQNNFFHDPAPFFTTGVYFSIGCRFIVSHNFFKDTNAVTGGACESIVEYNRFDGGSKDVTDGGMIYLAVSRQRGNHVRYNLLHKFNMQHCGAYLDGKSSGNYVYGNIISALGTETNFVKPWYSSSGHGNLCYANIVILRNDEQVKKSRFGGTDEATGKVINKDTIDESSLYYFYGPYVPWGQSEMGRWWLEGHRPEEIQLYLHDFDREKWEKRHPDYISSLVTSKIILDAYKESDYMVTYMPVKISGKSYSTSVEDGYSVWIPPYLYLDENGEEKEMPAHTVEVENESLTMTYEEIAAFERMQRQPAYNIIKNNIILGGSEDSSKVITYSPGDYPGIRTELTTRENNFFEFDYNKVLENADEYDYTIKKEALSRMKNEMGDAFVSIIKELDKEKIGLTE